jgi:hypothetical protein
MSEYSQDGRPAISRISMQASVGRGDDLAADRPSCSHCHHDASPASTWASTRPPSSPGVFSPYSVLRIFAVLTGGGAAGLLITMAWPQAAAMLGTICAIIGAGLAILDVTGKKDGNGTSGHDRD